MEIVFALSAACTYGVADYLGGRATRSLSAMTVTFLGQLAGFGVLLTVVLVAGSPVPQGTDWLWSGCAGIVGSTGLLAFYRAMGSGYMTVAAPISAVTTAAVPVIVGLSTGERPGVWALVGIPLALVAIALVSDLFGPHHRRAPRVVVLMAFAAGCAFGSLFVFLDRTAEGTGLWPVVLMRVASIPYMALVIWRMKQKLKPAFAHKVPVFGSGILDSTANALYLVAVREGLMSLVAVIVSLYPATTLALATGIDKERVHRPQIVGIAIAAVAVVMITVA